MTCEISQPMSQPSVNLRRLGGRAAFGLGAALSSLLLHAGAWAQAPGVEGERFHEIYKELIEINTSHSVGDTTQAACAMRQRLLSAGFTAADVEVIEPFPKKGNMLARFKGTGQKRPLL